ncbi:MAG: acyltransferase [Carboxylicivirga sp.]|nr:acyltransferase [Carboxylicivirga sp.]MCT4647644.1 acyltransferase [Carboxylicivirga sp.]
MPFNRFYLGNQSTIEDFCTVNNGVGKIYIGDDTRIGLGSVLIGPVYVGNHVRLAQNVVISALNHNYQDIELPISKQGVNTSEVYVGDETWIGANAVILPGVFIGKHCVIAAGSVVTKNVPSYSVVAGNPARVVKEFHHESNKWIRKIA